MAPCAAVFGSAAAGRQLCAKPAIAAPSSRSSPRRCAPTPSCSAHDPSGGSTNGFGAPEPSGACSTSAPNGAPAALSSPIDRGVATWPKKSDMYLLRSDGFSCSRETVAADGSLSFSCTSSQQHLLAWKTRPKCVMVLKKLGDELMEEYIDTLRYLGEDLGMRVVVEPHDYEELSGLCLPWVHSYAVDEKAALVGRVDFIVCLGGDGLILHAAYLFGSAIPPVISFKLGSLGFLTAHDYVHYRRYLRDVIRGCQQLASCSLEDEDGGALLGVHITLRMRLLCEVCRHGVPIPGETYEVLNEVVLSRGAHPFLSKIEVYERDNLITMVQADGVMLATPTGSTAYSVAAGGSMVHPNVPAILFTPICPHSLSFRPVILPDYAEIELRIAQDTRSPAQVTFDGKATRDLLPGESVRVRMSPNPVPTINHYDQTTDWFSAIERCFKWNDRQQQKQFSPSSSTASLDYTPGGLASQEDSSLELSA